MITLSSTLLVQPSSPADAIDHSLDPSSLQVAFFYASLYLIAIAQGADKPCGLAFAADQFDPDDHKERASRSSLFNWWFFSMAIGIYVSVAVVSYIQENVGWGVGFGLLCGIMLCAFAVFLAGTPTYRVYAPTPDTETPFSHLAVLVRSSVFTKRHHHREEDDEGAAAKSEQARGVLRLVPIWAACLAYGVVYAQVMTLFNKQGRTMDRRVYGGLELPPASLQTIGAGSVLAFVPIYDHVLVPALRWSTGNPSGLTLLQRVGTGMAVSLTAVSLAALVEARRLEVALEHGLVDNPGATVPMSCVWLVPQYAMMGVADVFALVGMQEFFYDQMPGEMRSIGLAMYLSVTGLGGFISSALISFIDRVTSSGGGDSWFADNLNRAHLDYFYWLLAGISAAELVIYLWLARSYVYNNRKTTI
jgi:peptide/histidine transporter 3/4